MFDESESEPLTEPDTPNHTKFYGSDTDAEYDGTYRLDGTESFVDYYDRLAALNTGIYNGRWTIDESERWRIEGLAIFDAISGQLELTPYQKQVSRHQFSTLDLSELSSPGGIDAALIAIMVAAIVCRQDRRFYHPSRDDNTNDRLFVDLINRLDYPERAVYSCYEKVLDRVTL